MRSGVSVLFALLVGCVACAGPLTSSRPRAPLPEPGYHTEYLPVWIDAKFSDKEKGDIRAALDAWDTALNGYAQFIVVSDKIDRPADDLAVTIRRLISKQGLTSNRHPMSPETLDTPELAHYDPDADNIMVLSDRIGFRDLHIIMMHEIGHYFISPPVMHVLIKGSLMFPSYDFQPACVDKVTAMYVGEVQKWDWRHMVYCEIP